MTDKTEWTMAEVFGDGGFLSQHLDGYELRQPQLDMAQGCFDSIQAERHIAVEAPTGTGKSIAYAAPFVKKIIDSREADEDNNRLVIATGNIALQEQLVEKDLPLLASVLPGEFSFALVKGRNNYLCREGLDTWRLDLAQKVVAFGKDATDMKIEQIYSHMTNDERAIADWAQKTKTGDKSELEFGVEERLWKKVSKTADECLGKDCPFRDECFSEKNKLALQTTDVIVTNYHFLFAAIKMRMMTDRDVVLPPFKYLVLDEAHKAPDIARSFFGWELSEWAINLLRVQLDKFTRVVADKGLVSSGITNGASDLLTKVTQDSKMLFANVARMVEQGNGAVRLQSEGALPCMALSQTLRDIGEVFDAYAKADLNKRDKGKAKKNRDRAREIAGQLADLHGLDRGDSVYFVESYGMKKNSRICCRMLDVGDLLWPNMFGFTDCTVITSATLAIEKSCEFVREEIGLKEGKELIVDSPFDYKKQALLIVSPNAPDPKAEGYSEKVGKVAKYIVEQAEGRTLGLFTSYRSLKIVAEILRDDLGSEYNILVQGEAPRMKLVKEFKEDVSSVLLGTESFWTGIDVPGEACSCVIVEKIPFPVPGNPVLEALGDRSEGHMGGFWNVSVPRAILQMRQGVGRLIRRATDHGVVVILDNRLVTKGYGSMFLGSFPRMRRASTMKGGIVKSWLAKIGV
jgi:ATP-dependent DNA helicase DinG